MDSNDFKTGWICFFNKAYGFIQCEDDNNYFFHRSSIAKDSPYFPKLLAKAQFQLVLIEEGPHAGKKQAINVCVVSKQDIDNFDLYVGNITRITPKFCQIQCSNLEKPTLFFINRSLEHKETYAHGDFLIFSPVKSSKRSDEYFALFAYKLTNERNLSRLLQLHSKDFRSSAILSQINQASKTAENQNLLQIMLQDEWNADHSEELTRKAVLEKYAKMGTKINPHYFSQVYDEKELLYRWETGETEDISDSLLLKYFTGANITTKREIIARLKSKAHKLLIDYFEYAIRNRLFKSILNVRIFLELTYGSKKESFVALFEQRKDQIIAELSAEQIQDLVDKKLLPTDSIILTKLRNEQDIISNTDYDNIDWDLLSEEEQSHRFNTVFIQDSTEKWNTKTMMYFRAIQKDQPVLLRKWLTKSFHQFNPYQKLLLFIHDLAQVTPELDETNLALANLTLFEKVILANKLKLSALSLFDDDQGAFEEEIYKLISSYSWDELFKPTTQGGDSDEGWGLLDELYKLYQMEKWTNFSTIALFLYNTLPEQDVYRVRIWLKGFVNEDLFEYQNFKSPYKLLSKEEKTDFKRKAEIHANNYIGQVESNSLLPCQKPEILENGNLVYTASIGNCHFKKDQFCICLENGSHSAYFNYKGLSAGFNRLNMDSSLNQIKLTIQITPAPDSKVSKLEGLDALLDTIIRNQIAASLSKFGKESKYKTQTFAYAENLELRKAAITFLNEKQIEGCEIIKLHEPKNFYRKLDAESGVDSYQLSGLFTLPIETEYLLIWENLDLDNDKATFVFKCSVYHHQELVARISKAVTSYPQLRSTLISKKDDAHLNAWRDYLGYIGSVRKPRFSNGSLRDWIDKIFAIAKNKEVSWSDTEPEKIISISRSVQFATKPLTPQKFDAQVRVFELPELGVARGDETGGSHQTLKFIKNINNEISSIKEMLEFALKN
ncbi:MAG: cold shock domain-containing protein [Sphingobacteriaceae bacterium]|nr:cold shock domain-containing protein [Sphingobacteriaceae bacterium]